MPFLASIASSCALQKTTTEGEISCATSTSNVGGPQDRGALSTARAWSRYSHPPTFSLTSKFRVLQTAADNARSRMKTNLEAKEGDEDLIEYYYIVLHPQTMTGFEYRRSVGKKFWRETRTRLMERFGDNCPGLYIPEKE